MNRLLPGLVWDLHKRCRAIEALLESPPAYPEVNDYAAGIYARVEQLRRDTVELAEDPDLGAAIVAADHLRSYKQLAEQVYILEAFALPAITRYGDEDRFLTRLVGKIVAQVRYPLPSPLVTAFSSEYYSSYPVFNLVQVPAGESALLLGLGDLGHELAHILYLAYEADLRGHFLDRVSTYIQGEQMRDYYRQAPAEYQLKLAELAASWQTYWTEEFSCDLVATYMFGPAYAWQHIRLTAGLGRDIYQPGFGDLGDHPADEARMRAILTALSQAGLLNDTGQLEQAWDNYVMLRGAAKPQDYDLCYPGHLLESLVQIIYNGCQRLGLRPYTQQDPGHSEINVPRLLGEAWNRVREGPAKYGQWEEERLGELHRLLE